MKNPQPHRLLAQGVSKTYGAVRALDDVTFELLPGEVMALLGENGAGKSTIVKVISGLVHPDTARFEMDGRPVDLSNSSSSQRAGIAVVQQELSSVGPLSVAENLVLGQQGAPVFWSRRRLNAAARPLLARVGLDKLDPSTPVEALSVAERQLIEIARVLSRDAKVVVFDEPTAALSDAEIARVLQVVRNLAADGVSVVYVTHRLGEVFEVCDRVTIFRNGQSTPPIPTAELDVNQVIAMMIGRELGDLYPEPGETFGEPVLSVTGLTAPGLRSPVNLSVRRGEILGLTGQIGSGTSDFMATLAGVRPVLTGQVTVDKKQVDLRGRMSGIRHGIAYCSPDRKKDGIFATLSISRNLSSPWLHRVSSAGLVQKAEEQREATRAAESFAIDITRMESHVGTLSGGNQQKVALAKWVGISPKVLLVEEPTRGVDVGARAEIYRRLRELCDSGLAVIVSSSDTHEVLGLSDTIATFYRGEQTSIRSQHEWSEPELVREVMHREESHHA